MNSTLINFSQIKFKRVNIAGRLPENAFLSVSVHSKRAYIQN